MCATQDSPYLVPQLAPQYPYPSPSVFGHGRLFCLAFLYFCNQTKDFCFTWGLCVGFLTTTHINSIQIISWAEPISQVQCALLLSAPLLSEKMLHIFMCFSMKIKNGSTLCTMLPSMRSNSWHMMVMPWIFATWMINWMIDLSFETQKIMTF